MSQIDRAGTFAPAVHVLSEAPRVPRPPDLRFEAILERFPGMAAAQAVCLTGSTAAGWGNALSDVDIFVFTDGEIELPDDESAETWTSNEKVISWQNWMGRYGDTLVDIQIWRPDAVQTVLAPFLRPDGPLYCNLSEKLQEFIYCVSVAVPLKNPAFFEETRAVIERSSYGRALARSLKVATELKLTDVGGQLASGDVRTARLTATLAAQSAADHCLVLAGDLCRTKKWMMRRLESRPEAGIGVAEYQSMVLEGARPGESEYDFALRTARWAQTQLVRMEELALS